MKVYICVPREDIMRAVAVDPDEDGLPFTNSKRLAIDFMASRKNSGDNFYTLKVVKMTDDEYVQYRHMYSGMEIVMHYAEVDVGDPRFNAYPNSVLEPFPVLEIEKSFFSDTIYTITDGFSMGVDLLDSTKVKKKLRKALHMLGFLQVKNPNVPCEEFDKYSRSCVVDYNSKKLFNDYSGKLFEEVPF